MSYAEKIEVSWVKGAMHILSKDINIFQVVEMCTECNCYVLVEDGKCKSIEFEVSNM